MKFHITHITGELNQSISSWKEIVLATTFEIATSVWKVFLSSYSICHGQSVLFVLFIFLLLYKAISTDTYICYGK